MSSQDDADVPQGHLRHHVLEAGGGDAEVVQVRNFAGE